MCVTPSAQRWTFLKAREFPLTTATMTRDPKSVLSTTQIWKTAGHKTAGHGGKGEGRIGSVLCHCPLRVPSLRVPIGSGSCFVVLHEKCSRNRHISHHSEARHEDMIYSIECAMHLLISLYRYKMYILSYQGSLYK
jgi:hypothetical protein